MEWKVNEDKIVGYDGDITIMPTAKQLYSATDKILIEDTEYDFKLESVRFSKLISLNFSIELFFENKNIKIKLKAYKGKETFDIKYRNNGFDDYLIINGCCYFLDPTISIVNDIIKLHQIKDISSLTFFEYLNFVKSCEINKIQIINGINDKINVIKDDLTLETNNLLKGTLFPYQKTGVKWLNYMADGNCGCILADSMGLGKTLQIIMLLAHIKETKHNSHSLVIAPVSLLENWKREIEKFYPSLSCYVNHGEEAINYYKDLLDYDVIITSYGKVQTGLSMYQMINWNALILDEAQNIKNPLAKRTKYIKMLDKDFSVAVSGTPFENHITDVWSIVDFILPGYLGTLRSFEASYEDDLSSAISLEKLISPIMLRRKVEDVAKDLPDKVEIPQPMIMSLDEAKFYSEELRKVEEIKTLKLDTIQKLRMFCTHPSVYDDRYKGVDPISVSQKYQRCCEILEEIISNEEKAIIFTSFNEMNSLFVSDLSKRFGVSVMSINGKTPADQRQQIVDSFSEIKGAAILILNPKAAGVGLNITSANHVIHYNLEWNPAIENQASARAYRKGQNKTVFIHRLYYTNTIEELINEKIEHKKDMSDAVVVGNEGIINPSDLARVLSLNPNKGVYNNEI